jgi:lysozyme family protein
MNPDKIIDAILVREGGYANRPADRGGPTKYGITQRKLAEWRGRPVTVDDVYRLSEAEARQIYRTDYIARPGFDRIADPRLAGLVVDCGVNHGPARAAKWLQQAANTLVPGALVVDGVFGQRSAQAVDEYDPLALSLLVIAQRGSFYGAIIASDARARKRTEDQALNAHGWMNRNGEFLRELALGAAA